MVSGGALPSALVTASIRASAIVSSAGGGGAAAPRSAALRGVMLKPESNGRR